MISLGEHDEVSVLAARSVDRLAHARVGIVVVGESPAVRVGVVLKVHGHAENILLARQFDAPDPSMLPSERFAADGVVADVLEIRSPGAVSRGPTFDDPSLATRLESSSAIVGSDRRRGSHRGKKEEEDVRRENHRVSWLACGGCLARQNLTDPVHSLLNLVGAREG